MNKQDKIEYLEKSNKNLKAEIQKLRQVIKSYKYDKLTGLLLRSDFQDRLDELWYEWENFGHRFIIAMVDLDGLHDLNRDISFEAGDDFIKQVADEIKAVFEDSNVFRAGGDEFMILKRGNDYKFFNERLDKISRSTVASVIIDEANVKEYNLENEQAVFNKVDALVIAKKSGSRKRREGDDIKDSEDGS